MPRGIFIDISCYVSWQENVEESFEELQGLFEEMFQEDLDSFGIACQATTCVSYSESSNSNDKRVSVDMNLKKTKVDDSSGFNSHVEKFCLGVSSLWSVVRMHLMLRLCYFYILYCLASLHHWNEAMGNGFRTSLYQVHLWLRHYNHIPKHPCKQGVINQVLILLFRN